MMRFKKGSSVEVFSKKEVSTGAWLCAEVISGNGHTYSIKYRHFPNSSEPVVERVPRKAIRPCPSPVEGPSNWVTGDIVEAFHNFSWKMARISKVAEGERFLVRILGVSKGWFHKSFLRVRQCWQDDQWFVIGKGLEIDDMSMGKNNTNITEKKHVGDDNFCVGKHNELKMPHAIPTGMLKRRSPFGLYDLEAHPVAAQKKRLIEKGSSQQVYSVNRSPTSEKVDAIVYPNVTLGENHMNSSFNVATAEFSVLDTSSRSYSFVIDCTTSVDTDSCASSSGSCNSMGNDSQNLPFRCSTQLGNDMDDYFSDAESSCAMPFEKEECSIYSGKQSGLEFRRSELDIYGSAIEDLYSLGPLSWDDEAKLTNLRHVLHISDDEHLMLLRNLISANRKLIIC